MPPNVVPDSRVMQTNRTFETYRHEQLMISIDLV
jgi:hypothetical protein